MIGPLTERCSHHSLGRTQAAWGLLQHAHTHTPFEPPPAFLCQFFFFLFFWSCIIELDVVRRGGRCCRTRVAYHAPGYSPSNTQAHRVMQRQSDFFADGTVSIRGMYSLRGFSSALPPWRVGTPLTYRSISALRRAVSAVSHPIMADCVRGEKVSFKQPPPQKRPEKFRIICT